MKDETEEQYVFLSVCSIDFGMALKSFSLVDDQECGYPQLVCLRDAVICYGRPFTKNQGTNKKTHKLEKDLVPERYLCLHQEIMNLRDTFFAHSDISKKNYKLNRLVDSGSMVEVEFEPKYLSDLKQQLKEMDKLIYSLQKSISEKKMTLEKSVL